MIKNANKNQKSAAEDKAFGEAEEECGKNADFRKEQKKPIFVAMEPKKTVS